MYPTFQLPIEYSSSLVFEIPVEKCVQWLSLGCSVVWTRGNDICATWRPNPEAPLDFLASVNNLEFQQNGPAYFSKPISVKISRRSPNIAWPRILFWSASLSEQQAAIASGVFHLKDPADSVEITMQELSNVSSDVTLTFSW